MHVVPSERKERGGGGTLIVYLKDRFSFSHFGFAPALGTSLDTYGQAEATRDAFMHQLCHAALCTHMRDSEPNYSTILTT